MAALVRAFANISGELEAAGYTDTEVERDSAALVTEYLKLREIIRKASGGDARTSRRTRPICATSATLHIRSRRAAQNLALRRHAAPRADRQNRHRRRHQSHARSHIKSNRGAIAETIENNVRSKIIKDHLNDPAFYDKMSALLDEIVKARKSKAIEYEEAFSASPKSRSASKPAEPKTLRSKSIRPAAGPSITI